MVFSQILSTHKFFKRESRTRNQLEIDKKGVVISLYTFTRFMLKTMKDKPQAHAEEPRCIIVDLI